MTRARTKLEPGERLLLACRPHPAALLPALLKAVAAVLATATVVALLAHSTAPHGVRLALDLLVLAFAARAALRFTRAVWQWDRTLLALTTRRVFVVAPRGAVRREWQTMSLAGIHSARVSHSFGGRLLGYGTLTLGDGPQGRDVRFVTDAERVAEAILEAGPNGRTWGNTRGRLSLISRPLIRASRDRGGPGGVVRSVGLRLRGRAGPEARALLRAGPASRPRSDARARA